MIHKNLDMAKKRKNDEFYTRIEDIENELKYYTKHFENKTVYCNCDNPQFSKFFTYFMQNFNRFRLKKLVCSFYSENRKPYVLSYDGNNAVRTQLDGNGDFRSQECIDLLKQADIVVTNPPFSLFREYVALLMKYDRKFLIIGNSNALAYGEIFPLIKNDEVRLGLTSPSMFVKPDGTTQKFGNITWFTNLDCELNYDIFTTNCRYNPEDYPKYDNYDAIEVSETKKIPCDYKGVMGVPISFMDKYNPNQFEIIGTMGTGGVCDMGRAMLENGVEKYKRILVRWKQLPEQGQNKKE